MRDARLAPRASRPVLKKLKSAKNALNDFNRTAERRRVLFKSFISRKKKHEPALLFFSFFSHEPPPPSSACSCSSVSLSLGFFRLLPCMPFASSRTHSSQPLCPSSTILRFQGALNNPLLPRRLLDAPPFCASSSLAIFLANETTARPSADRRPPSVSATRRTRHQNRRHHRALF